MSEPDSVETAAHEAPPRLRVEITRDAHAKDLPLPRASTEGAAGLDLRAAVTDPVSILPGERRLIPTGWRIALPGGFEAQIRPRSGLALRHGILIPNAPGTIDSDYRGEVAVLLVNLGRQPVMLERGQRVAQLVVSPIARADLEEVAELDDTLRGSGGFGHTRS